ncbi:MAG TPA: dihydrofolate reductase [Chitinophagaceae bacterium]|nr:dihydrofolate reductase [Chitinophagaceae bacterium]
MIISLLLAADENNVIGFNNQLPWHLPNDLKYFKNLTWGMPIVMGRKTFESIGKPLPGRRSIVITRNKEWKERNVETVHSIDEAVLLAGTSVKEIFIIGGAEIYNSVLPDADRVYLTRIHHRFEGDVFFKGIDPLLWTLAREVNCSADEKNSYNHSFQVWERN